MLILLYLNVHKPILQQNTSVVLPDFARVFFGALQQSLFWLDKVLLYMSCLKGNQRLSHKIRKSAKHFIRKLN